MKAKCRILVVEDDAMIRKLLRRQLTGLGFCVDIAGDGTQGLSLWASKPYDLVLTDCSMPEMDGFELAAKIRGAHPDPASLVPIVIITGHAAADRNSWPAVGISDAISKPVAAAELRRVLARWVSVPDAGPQAVDQPKDMLRPLPVILENPAIMRRIVDSFIRTMPDYLEAIDRACASGSWPDIAAAAHKLKSAAELMGGTELARLCRVLEESAEGAADADIARLSAQIREHLRELEQSLRAER